MADRSDTDGKRFKPGNADEDGDYIVGKGRPPEGGKFRKGDGRKRGGRPKGTRNLDTDVLAEANATIQVNEGGRPVKISKQLAMIKRIFDIGFNGNVAAMREVLSMIDRALGRAEEKGDRTLPENDLAIIQAHFASLSAEAAHERDEDDPAQAAGEEGDA